MTPFISQYIKQLFKSCFLSPLYITLVPVHNVAFKNLIKATNSVSFIFIFFVIFSEANHYFHFTKRLLFLPIRLP